jgi:purine-cytosine permease-like protein
MTKKTLKEKLDGINEYEREPVPKDKVKGFKSFVGMVAGEHIAGTEFVIGPMFVAYGVSAPDLLWGLLIGNLLAVLSWTFVCAPIATKTRITIFYHLEKISGFKLVTFYNVVNGLLFAFVAASMIGVSATAVGIPFNIEMPKLNDILPTGPGWVITVLLIGSVITVVSMFGYDQVSKFANIFAPWMPLIFLGGAIAVLPGLGVTKFSEFWPVAQERIWTGVPMAGQIKFTMWHVVAFAWLCNGGMHLGLSDTSIYRYAKKPIYGLASAAGMFIGHGMAWLASGILCAAALGVTTPGPIAYGSMGLAGALCVVVAGWTTANPTMYRAGLAIQGVLPNMKRWKITLIIGIIVSLLACFPGVVTRLMEFIAFYALLAVPVGAVVFADVYFIPKLGLKQNYAEFSGTSFSWIVGLTWVLSFAIAKALDIYFQIDGLEFFLAIPGWFASAAIYVTLNYFFQNKQLKPAYS